MTTRWAGQVKRLLVRCLVWPAGDQQIFNMCWLSEFKIVMANHKWSLHYTLIRSSVLVLDDLRQYSKPRVVRTTLDSYHGYISSFVHINWLKVFEGQWIYFMAILIQNQKIILAPMLIISIIRQKTREIELASITLGSLPLLHRYFTSVACMQFPLIKSVL